MSSTGPRLPKDLSGGQARNREGASLAALLRERRLALGLTLSQIEFDTKIRPKYIAALEERNFDDLPVDIYLERIVKNYAFYLGVDAKVALKLLKLDKDRFMRARRYPGSFTQVDEMGEIEDHFVEPIKGSGFVFSPKAFAVMLGVFATLLVGFYLSRLFIEYTDAPELTISEPASGMMVDSNNVRVVGHAEPGSVVSINNLVVSVNEDGNWAETLYLQDGTNKVLVRAEDNGKISEKELVIQADIPERRNLASDDNVVVELAAEQNEKSWVRVIADGSQVYEGILEDDTVFRADKYVYVLAGNAGALAVTYNGEDKGALGEKGEVVHEVYGEAPDDLDTSTTDAENAAA